MREIDKKWLIIFLTAGIFLVVAGALLWMEKSSLATGMIKKSWPVFGILIGTSFLSTGVIQKNHRIAYFISGLSLILLCCVFLPFSLGVATISFRSFVLRILPVIMILGGAGLVILFVAQTYNKKLILPDEGQDLIE